MKKLLSIFAITLMISGLAARAEVKLPSVISDNMVLQQQTEAAIWGAATPGKTVTVRTSWNGSKVSTTADPESGKWLVRVKTPKAGGPYEITISDGKAVTLKNILIGEVWFCSGQSNMDMPVKGYGSQPVKGGADYIIAAKPSRPIRMCTIKKNSSTTASLESTGSWLEHTPANVANTSATAYFFAEYIQQTLGVPVGIIVTAWGGSSIETWITRKIIAAQFPELSLAHLDGTVPVKFKHKDPCLLFNGQVSPLIPFTFKGMIWYQGEENRMRAPMYAKLQTAYVAMMRELFQVPDAPFYFVQIAPYKYNNPNGFESGYFVEAQAKSLETIPHSGMAVTCDVGEYGTIHPCEKQVVGKRLAYLALQNDYGYDAIAADAPTYKSVEFKGSQAYVTFNVDPMGLGPMGRNITGFEVAGKDRTFFPAKAFREKNDIIRVFSEDVPNPVAVRYCFRNWCVGGLYNNYGIPAAPFRTDNW